MKIITTALLSLLFAFASVTQVQAQNVLASSAIYGTEIGTSGTYNYTLTLTALANSAPIESFWFAWVPGTFFLQSTPSDITGDNSWTGAGDGGSIQFAGGTPITAGNTVTFTFQSIISPAEMTTDVGSASSVVYPGVINFSGTSPNETIGVETVAAPPPSPTNVLASSTISGTEIGATGTYNYTLSLTALSNSAPIESFWFAWVPGTFFLQSTPSDITGDNGWTGAGDSGSIQFTGGTPITAGNTVTFTFQSTITPAEMTADVGAGSSVVYPGAINSSPNETIGVQTLTPSTPLTLGITTTSASLNLSWNSEVGKTYQLQALADLTQTNWSPSGAPIVGTGSSVGVTNLPTAGPQMYFRLAVQP